MSFWSIETGIELIGSWGGWLANIGWVGTEKEGFGTDVQGEISSGELPRLHLEPKAITVQKIHKQMTFLDRVCCAARQSFYALHHGTI